MSDLAFHEPATAPLRPHPIAEDHAADSSLSAGPGAQGASGHALSPADASRLFAHYTDGPALAFSGGCGGPPFAHDDDAFTPLKPSLGKVAETAVKALEDAKKAAAEKQKAAEAKAAAQEEEAKKDPDYKKDAAGALDRVKARDDLKDLFTIVDAKTDPSKRRPNEVTQEEFAQIAKRYSDIRLNRTDLKVDTAGIVNKEEQAKAKDRIMKDIARIMQTRSGRDLVGALADNVTGTGKSAVHNVTTIGTGHANTNYDGKTAQITYGPQQNNPIDGADKTQANTWSQFIRGDIALYHEMVHALHFTKGTKATGTVSKADAKTAKDVGIQNTEYQATGLPYTDPSPSKIRDAMNKKYNENRYRSERTQLKDGTFNDYAPPPSLTAQPAFAGWEDYWKDEKLKPRPQYVPDST